VDDGLFPGCGTVVFADDPAESGCWDESGWIDHHGEVFFEFHAVSPCSGVVIGNGSGIIGIGADGEELRVTCEDPAGGSMDITVTYYTIES